MTRGDVADIYDDADIAYRAQTSASDSALLFSGIQRKLGRPRDAKQLGTNINVNTAGSFLSATFETNFDPGVTATETIVWHSYGGAYHLQQYDVQSAALLTR